jgi:pimeloyl-ACP methyl ester carboxylesterase
MELEVLLYSGLSKEWFSRIDVPVGEFQNQTVSIRTIIISDKNLKLKPLSESDRLPDGRQKETLVIMHGYGGCSAMFFPIFKQLSIWFDIILLDIIGFGASS